MHSSFFTPAIGLAILSLTSARVLEKRDVCWQDPPYKALWNNPSIHDDVNTFCAGLLGLEGGSYCAANKTATVYVQHLSSRVKLIITGLLERPSQPPAPSLLSEQSHLRARSLSQVLSSNSTSATHSLPSPMPITSMMQESRSREHSLRADSTLRDRS